MLHTAYIGQKLLQRGFKTWFLYMFKAIEGRDFIVEALHEPLFKFYQAVYDLEISRGSVNLSPRSAKTQMAKYFVVFAYTINPKCNFIYTSYSQELLGDIARDIAHVFMHPIYKALYPDANYEKEETKSEAVDAFWKEYLLDNYRQAKYTSRKIVTSQGGVCLFSAMGATITGFGASIRGAEGFTGCIIIDDAQKPAEAESEVMQKKVARFFSETLLSRCNNSSTPIVNIQQRLNVKDLSGYLEERYNFNVLKLPLIDDNGVCQLPSQYTKERIEELKKDYYTWTTQYQQCPIARSGKLIKLEYFSRYRYLPESFERLYVVCDTAFEVKKQNDYSVCGLWGVSDKQLYLIDMEFGRWTYSELKATVKNKFYEWSERFKQYSVIEGVYIEHKASGISLIQDLRDEHLPISNLEPTTTGNSEGVSKDKYARYLLIQPTLESHLVWLPDDKPFWMDEFETECRGFNGGAQATHDDMIDVLIYAATIFKRSAPPTEEEWAQVANVFSSF